MAAATAVVGMVVASGLGRIWVAVAAVIAAAVFFGWSTGQVTPATMLTVGRWLAKHVFRAVRSVSRKASTWRGEAGPRPDRAQVRAWSAIVREGPPAGEDGVRLVEVGRAATLLGFEPRPRLTPTQSTALARSAEAAGFAVEPDARDGPPTYARDQWIAVYPGQAGWGPPIGPRYFGAAAIFRVGLYIAAADGTVSPAEIDAIERFIDGHFRLGPGEARRIGALKALLARVPPTSLAGLGKELQARLDPDQRALVGRVLVGVAASDGVVAKGEVAALRAAYRSLGIDPAGLDAVLAEIRSPAAPAPAPKAPPSAPAPAPIPARAPTSPAAPREAAAPPPAPTTTPRPAAEEAVAIDPARLERVLGETRDVGRILGEAMRESEAEEADRRPDSPPKSAPATPAPAPVPGGDPRFAGIDARYRGFLAELLERADWSRDDFAAAARRHGLMPSSAVEVLNEWSQDRLGDLLLEPVGDDGGLRIQAHLLTNATVRTP